MDNVVEWDEFSDFMLLEGMAKDKQEQLNDQYLCQERMTARPQRARHSGALSSIVFCAENRRYYTTSSHDASIRSWSSTMQHHRTVSAVSTVSTVPDVPTSTVTTVVNDLAVCSCPGVSQLVAAATRSINFYDLQSLEKVDSMQLQASPLCIDAWEYKGQTWVGFGDDMGCVHLLHPPDAPPPEALRAQLNAELGNVRTLAPRTLTAPDVPEVTRRLIADTAGNVGPSPATHTILVELKAGV